MKKVQLSKYTDLYTDLTSPIKGLRFQEIEYNLRNRERVLVMFPNRIRVISKP